ncbi:zinc finger BED domain-containing protein 1-like [Xyrichtys novacula]|uniref:Zinc finger BED domain-containing protein 1-like n=1 Tax=Xyrichtys novacula TaxID=13765 RepID=A0AAV1FAZ0_XYRNO|nr:zinc finger BED domain-containing protein 1-like [Xyrichtys novacula]
MLILAKLIQASAVRKKPRRIDCRNDEIMEKKGRVESFSAAAQTLLMELYEEYKGKIQKKGNTVATVKAREMVWQSIMDRLNSLARLNEEDFRRAEDFINFMKVLYTSTLCVSSEKSPTCGQILPIFKKLEEHLANDDIRNFLKVATVLDPRFKHQLDAADTIWDQIQRKLIEQSTEEVCGADGDTVQSENEDEQESQQPPCNLPRKTPLEELFAEEEAQSIVSQQSSTSIKKRVERELQMYKEVPPVLMSVDPAAWWWNQQKTYPFLSDLVFSYLCVQASSTPSERVFSTAGDTICPERSRILAEKSDMVIFLNKNYGVEQPVEDILPDVIMVVDEVPDGVERPVEDILPDVIIVVDDIPGDIVPIYISSSEDDDDDDDDDVVVLAGGDEGMEAEVAIEQQVDIAGDGGDDIDDDNDDDSYTDDSDDWFSSDGEDSGYGSMSEEEEDDAVVRPDSPLEQEFPPDDFWQRWDQLSPPVPAGSPVAPPFSPLPLPPSPLAGPPGTSSEAQGSEECAPSTSGLVSSLKRSMEEGSPEQVSAKRQRTSDEDSPDETTPSTSGLSSSTNSSLRYRTFLLSRWNEDSDSD